MISVIIVEDDPMVREINEKFLKKVSDYELVKSVGSIEEAKKVIQTEKPQLVLLDMFFPNGKGIDVLKWIRDKGYNTDVIMITADKDKNTIEESLRFGVFDYLIKPFTFERFKESLEGYKIRVNRLSNLQEIDQNELDSITLKEKDDEVDNDDMFIDVKGFNKKTFDRIVQGISEMNGIPFTSQELADKIGISRITARRYLDHLEREGELFLEMEYGKVGRPRNVYKIKE